jgi:membrane-associated phospholipid phosphatase
MIGALWALESWLLEGPTRILDEGGLAWVAEHRTTGTLAVARAVTHLGDLWVVLLVGLVLVVLARRRSGRWDSAKLVATVIVGALATTTAAKELTARLRPEDALTSTVSLAFPSGHASRVGCGVRAGDLAGDPLGEASGDPPRRGRARGGNDPGDRLEPGAAGAHWPTDVLAGWVLGLVWFVAVLAAHPSGARRGPRSAAGTQREQLRQHLEVPGGQEPGRQRCELWQRAVVRVPHRASPSGATGPGTRSSRRPRGGRRCAPPRGRTGCPPAASPGRRPRSRSASRRPPPPSR